MASPARHGKGGVGTKRGRGEQEPAEGNGRGGGSDGGGSIGSCRKGSSGGGGYSGRGGGAAADAGRLYHGMSRSAGAGMGEGEGTRWGAAVALLQLAGAATFGGEEGAGAGVSAGEGASEGAGAGAGEEMSRKESASAAAGTQWDAAATLLQLAGAAGSAGEPRGLVPGPSPNPNAGGHVEVNRAGEEGREGMDGRGSEKRPSKGVLVKGGEAHRCDGTPVEERLRLRRLELRARTKGRMTSPEPPARGTESGSGKVGDASARAVCGGVVGRKRKASAAGAWEAVRAEKVQREVHWARVRAAVCAVLSRARRRERGKGQQRKKRTGHKPGTTTSVAEAAVPQAETSVVRETETANRPKRKCKDIPPGSYAPVKRPRGAPPGRPPGRPPDLPPPSPPTPLTLPLP